MDDSSKEQFYYYLNVIKVRILYQNMDDSCKWNGIELGTSIMTRAPQTNAPTLSLKEDVPDIAKSTTSHQ